MLRRTMVVGLLGLMLALAACGSNLSGATTGAGVAAQGTPGGFFGGGEMPLSMKLPAGTLMLEETALAVTSEQAKELLPLWQMIGSLQGSTTASQVELEATFGQIEEAMTAEQLAAIEDMDQEDMRALFDELGMGPQRSDSESDDEDRGGFGRPEWMMPPDGGEGGPGMGPGGFGNLDPEAQATAMAGRGRAGLGFGS
ncbi:MAG: hypothetical protein OEV76_09780, partial [Anaerolineae bacterium]|nr:hypothetical protein [Anaerolineae bacterium]